MKIYNFASTNVDVYLFGSNCVVVPTGRELELTEGMWVTVGGVTCGDTWYTRQTVMVCTNGVFRATGNGSAEYFTTGFSTAMGMCAVFLMIIAVRRGLRWGMGEDV